MGEDIIVLIGVAGMGVRVDIGEGAGVEVEVSAGSVVVGMVMDAEVGVALLHWVNTRTSIIEHITE